MSTAKAKTVASCSIREIAKKLHLPRSTFYYKPKQPAKDWSLKNQIEKVLHEHPSYGHKRLALELQINKKRARRVMRLFGIKPYRRRGERYRKPKDLGIVHQNLIQDMTFPTKPNVIWVSDFTRIPFHSRLFYLATIKDIVMGHDLPPLHSHDILRWVRHISL